MTASPAQPSPPPANPEGADLRRLFAIVTGVSVLIVLMLLAFAAPAVKSGAKDLPLAVSGPAPAVAQLTGNLAAKSPGTFKVTAHASAEAGAEAIKARKAIGGLAITESGLTVQTASAAGAPYAALLKGIGAQLAASGQKVSYTELVPLPARDPAGAGLTALGLPLVFGGMASGVALALGYRGSVLARFVGVMVLSAVAGPVATAVLQYGFGSFTGSFWLTSACVAFGVAAISLTVLGLGLLLRHAGVALAAVFMLFVSNPLAGLAAGPAWLPHPWGTIGQFLPVGAAATAVRSAAFFDGAGATRAYLVLAAWAGLGAVLIALSGIRRPSAPAVS